MVVRDSVTALRLLCSMLAHLAVDLLDAAAWWAGDAAELGDLLFSSRTVLPDLNSEWARVLQEWGYLPVAPLAASASPPVAAQLLVLLHTYFRSVVARQAGQAACCPGRWVGGSRLDINQV